MSCAVAVGGLGVAGGVWLTYTHNFSGIAGLAGGAATLGVGVYGFILLKRNPPPNQIFRL
jgi:hypothetical protein